MRLLVTSDRPETLDRAVRFANLFPHGRETEIFLLGVYKHRDQAEANASELHRFAADLEKGQARVVQAERGLGDAVDVILREIREHNYDLIVLGVHRRRRLTLLRPKLVAKYIARRIHVPLLVVSPEWYRLEKILICTGAEPEDEQVIRFGGEFAARCGANVTLLHVMSQLQIIESANRDDLRSGVDAHIENETHEGQHLVGAMEILEAAGIQQDKYQVELAHGLVVDKIIEEGREGGFDLIILGAVGLSEDGERALEVERFMHENVPVRVLGKAQRPVLIVHADREGGSMIGGER
jgi:nucleotide-binding universal stress UspA family protein